MLVKLTYEFWTQCPIQNSVKFENVSFQRMVKARIIGKGQAYQAMQKNLYKPQYLNSREKEGGALTMHHMS